MLYYNKPAVVGVFQPAAPAGYRPVRHKAYRSHPKHLFYNAATSTKGSRLCLKLVWAGKFYARKASLQRCKVPCRSSRALT